MLPSSAVVELWLNYIAVRFFQMLSTRVSCWPITPLERVFCFCAGDLDSHGFPWPLLICQVLRWIQLCLSVRIGRPSNSPSETCAAPFSCAPTRGPRGPCTQRHPPHARQGHPERCDHRLAGGGIDSNPSPTRKGHSGVGCCDGRRVQCRRACGVPPLRSLGPPHCCHQPRGGPSPHHVRFPWLQHHCQIVPSWLVTNGVLK